MHYYLLIFIYFFFRSGRPRLDLRRPILPKIIAVEVNKTYVFTSYIVAYPKPIINWNKPSTGYFTNLTTDGVEHYSSIIVTSAADSALGEYIMFANNSKGNLFFSFTVVKEGKMIHYSKILFLI